MKSSQQLNELKGLIDSLRTDNQSVSDEIEMQLTSLINNQILLQKIIDTSSKAVFIIKGDTIKFYNQKAIEYFDLQISELGNGTISSFFEQPNRDEFIGELSGLIQSKNEQVTFESIVITKSGISVPVHIEAKKISVPDFQSAILIEVSPTDISARSKSEDQMVKEPKISFFENYLDQGILLLVRGPKSDDMLFSWDIEMTNLATGKLFEKENQEIVGKALKDFITADYDIELPESIDESYHEPFEVYLDNLKKHLAVELFGLKEGRLICKLSDITDQNIIRDQFNRNLQRNELLTEILDITNSSISYIEMFNRILERVGYHLKPKRILILFNSIDNKKSILHYQWHAKDIQPVASNFSFLHSDVPSWNKMLTERNMILGFSLKYLPADINSFLIKNEFNNAYVFPVWVENGLYGAICFENLENTDWDNTEINYIKMIAILLSGQIIRKMNEEKIIKAKEKAEEADRLKSSFLANMSHDIRIPMTAIIGFSDLLADEDLTQGEREEFIDLISKSGQDLLTLIDNIVDVAKIETGQLRVQKEPCSFSGIIEEIMYMYKKNDKLINHDDLNLILDFPAKFHQLPFETDVFRFKQICTNLIDNAIKFTEHGTIRFGISNTWGQTIEFYIQDTGIGIPEETQHIIFERFSKIDRSYTKEYNGTGLGLSICKSLVEMLNGEIRVVSAPGKGSTFYFTHPLPEEAAKVLYPDKTNEVKSPFNWLGKTIVIVEDVEQNYKYLEYMLSVTGSEIVWLKNGKEAVDYFKAEKPADAVLMDIRLPIMDGIEATRQISKLTEVPIIAQTAYTFGDEKELAMEAGCIGYITKPVNAPKMLTMLDEIFSKK
jgi:signal transduction histidine kinase/CheY-like chemotaxis protein